MQGPKVATANMRMTGYKVEDQAWDLSGTKQDTTRNNVTIEAIIISLYNMHIKLYFF